MAILKEVINETNGTTALDMAKKNLKRKRGNENE